MYEVTCSKRGGPRQAFFDFTDRFKFAQDSIAALRKSCPESLVSGLVRVDIMQSDEGHMVVNEFESLEADHTHSDRTMKPYCSLSDSLTMYYVHLLCSFAKEVLCDRKA